MKIKIIYVTMLLSYSSGFIANAQTLVPFPTESNNWATIIKDIIQSLFYAISALAVIWGFTSWRRQAKWRVKSEAAKSVLVGAYRVRDAINDVRSSFMLPAEWADREKSRDETDHIKAVEDRFYVYSKRYDRVREALSQWYPAIVEGEALFGDEARKRIDALENSAQRLKAVIEIHHDEEQTFAITKMASPDNQRAYKQESNILSGIYPGLRKGSQRVDESDDDGFQARLDSAVEEIKKYFERYIR